MFKTRHLSGKVVSCFLKEKQTDRIIFGSSPLEELNYVKNVWASVRHLILQMIFTIKYEAFCEINGTENANKNFVCII